MTANQVTLAAAAISVGLGGLLVFNADEPLLFLALPLWMALRMALNAIDGMLAREFGQKSALGAYLNELSDVVSDAALYLPFAFIGPFSPVWVAAVIFLAVLSEFAGALGVMAGASRRYDGPAGKSDRALVFGALGLAVAVLGSLPGWFAWIMPGLALLLALTVINRVRNGRTGNPVLNTNRHHLTLKPGKSPGRNLKRGDIDMKTRTAEIKTFSTHDGQDLSYRAWPALSNRPAGAVIILHRGHEHSGRAAHLVHELNLPELAFFAWDARGHGLSPGERGHSPGVGTSLRDVQTFVDHIRTHLSGSLRKKSS